MNNIIFIIMDSCRFDTCRAARTPNIDSLGPIERRYSFASWTSPSHYTMLMGMMPHTSPPGVFASEVYKQDFIKWRERTGVDKLDFSSFVPELSLPNKLRQLGYKTIGRVSLPVLNQFTTMSAHFDDYKLMDDHNDFAGMIDEMTFKPASPAFYFLNLGETHYPYRLTKEDTPILHGVHGVFKQLDKDESQASTADPIERLFNREKLEFLQQAQIKACEYVDGQLGRLLKKAPKGTWVIVTADHGELFGEEGYFGHGPIFHKKVFEVPFVEARI